jgi:hypothetical protein
VARLRGIRGRSSICRSWVRAPPAPHSISWIIFEKIWPTSTGGMFPTTPGEHSSVPVPCDAMGPVFCGPRRADVLIAGSSRPVPDRHRFARRGPRLISLGAGERASAAMRVWHDVGVATFLGRPSLAERPTDNLPQSDTCAMVAILKCVAVEKSLLDSNERFYSKLGEEWVWRPVRHREDWGETEEVVSPLSLLMMRSPSLAGPRAADGKGPAARNWKFRGSNLSFPLSLTPQ